MLLLFFLLQVFSETYISNAPSARIFPISFYLDSLKLISVIGGISEPLSKNDELWSYNLTSSLWTHITTPSDYTPGIRTGSCGISSSITQSYYTFGGTKQLGIYNDFWIYRLRENSVISR